MPGAPPAAIRCSPRSRSTRRRCSSPRRGRSAGACCGSSWSRSSSVPGSRGCRLVSSIRDVLQPPSKPSRARDAADRVRESYDAVLVHGDPAFVGLDASFPETERIRERIRYTGYVAQGLGPDAPPGVGEGEIVVSAGGGGGGAPAGGHRARERSRRLPPAMAGARRPPTQERTPWPAGAGPRRRTRSWSRTGPTSDRSSRGHGSRSPRRATTPSPTSWPPACRRCWSRSRPKASASSRFGPGFSRRPGVARVIDEDRLTARALLEAVRRARPRPAPERPVRLDGAAESAEAILGIARAAGG